MLRLHGILGHENDAGYHARLHALEHRDGIELLVCSARTKRAASAFVSRPIAAPTAPSASIATKIWSTARCSIHRRQAGDHRALRRADRLALSAREPGRGA